MRQNRFKSVAGLVSSLGTKQNDKSEFAKENNENYLTDEEQHKIIIKDYDMLFEYGQVNMVATQEEIEYWKGYVEKHIDK